VNQKILALSGRKQAGKDTCYKFLRSLCESLPRALPDVVDLPKSIGHFYYADALKRMCVDILGCPEELVYGTDAQKNTRVPHLIWENFPVPVYELLGGRTYVISTDLIDKQPQFPFRAVPDPGEDGDRLFFMLQTELVVSDKQSWPKRKRGPMTVREVLQYWGSEVFRRQYENVWADACIRAIFRSGVELAVITDCRFPNEVSAAQSAGGKVVRLTRVMFPEDTHISETALDKKNYDWSYFDAVIDNAEMSIVDQCYSLYRILVEWGWLPELPPQSLMQHYTRAAA
jgi:hypothetical protein